MFSSLHLVHYLPVLTTLVSAVFVTALLRHYRRRGSGTHLLWWAAGMSFYGLGTAFEATITLAGNSVALTKLWYVFGAIWGGYPLAQGSVYLHYSRRFANTLTAVSLPCVLIASALVLLSPTNAALLESFRPSGAILGWQWVRYLTPAINLYAVFFLIGTAILSAVQFYRLGTMPHRARGNALIACGALLPGIGGAFAKAGMVEALYVGEFVGLIFIWIGYKSCLKPTTKPSTSKERMPGVETQTYANL